MAKNRHSGDTFRDISKRIFADIRQYGWALPGFLIYYFILHSLFGAFCPFLLSTGFPCAGCGLTRAVLYLLRGEVSRAVDMNPSVIPLCLFGIYCGYFRYIKGKAVKGFKVIFPVLIFCMLVIYGRGMYLYFPDRAPYVYQNDNLFARCVPGYQDWVRRLQRPEAPQGRTRPLQVTGRPISEETVCPPSF